MSLIRALTRMISGQGIAVAVLLTLAPVAESAAQTALVPPRAPDSFADTAEKLLPTVVNISTTTTVSVTRGPENLQVPPGSPFEEMFREFFEQNRDRPRRSSSLGSGVVIDSSGFIVTNNHVIADADEISVIFNDSSVLPGKLIGRDAKTDLALIKVEAKKPLLAAVWGDSDKARIGDWVLAIGNPFGLGSSVTAGIISARGRDIRAGPYDEFIQTDAAINRGNSGGPLFNMKGEIVGINTAIYTPTGGSVGVGFSSPSNLVREVLDDLRKYGRTRRGWLGVRIQRVDDDIAESLGLEKASGALVAAVNEKGPADSAGIRSGDVILRFDGKPVEEMRRLPRIVAETEIGKPVDVEVWRANKKLSLKVQVGELEENEQPVQTAARPNPGPEGGSPERSRIADLGMTVTPLSEDLRKTFGIEPRVRGLVITEVEKGGTAAERNIKPGDVVVEVNNKPVTSIEELRRNFDELRKLGRNNALLLVATPTEPRHVTVPIPAK